MLAVAVDGQAWQVTDEQVSVVETTGAGDASAGAIVAALAAGADLATAAAFGVSAARIVLSDWGHSALVHADPLTEPLPGIRIRRHT
jgi:sugar/nucleoside kinase (ribokinase family)